MSETKYRFYHPVQVRFADTDAQGHVFFGTYFTYFDEGVSAYLRIIGFPWHKLQESGLDIYYVDAGCQYKGSAVFEDRLHVHTRLARIGNSSLTLECAIYKEADGQLIATGHITSVIVDQETGRPVRVPDELRRQAAAYEEDLEL